MKVHDTDIDDVKIIEPVVYGVLRGFFLEDFKERSFLSMPTGIQSTIEWYLQHEDWWRPLLCESGRVADTMYKS